MSNDIINTKKWHYIGQLYVNECAVFGEKAEDVHHIKFQCTADKNNIIDKHIQKDTKSNLVTLCKKCHDEVHNGSLEVRGYIQTSEGVK